VRDKVAKHPNIASCCNLDTFVPIAIERPKKHQIDALRARGYLYPRRELWCPETFRFRPARFLLMCVVSVTSAGDRLCYVDTHKMKWDGSFYYFTPGGI